MTPDVIVIGGGAAGLMAAGRLADLGVRALLLERGDRVGRKLAITGKGRCNLTNACDESALMAAVTGNPRFLYAAFAAFGPRQVMDLLESLGVPLKVERGGRVFPVSDRAADVVDALRRYALSGGNVLRTGERVREVLTKDGAVIGVRSARGEMTCPRVLVCTGGLSYPRTGSDGDGYAFASGAGLKVTPRIPSLVPLETEERWPADAMGLSLKNVGLTVRDAARNDKILYEDFGEMLFTHFGVSGPMILSASAHLRPMERGRYRLRLDLKPALDEKTLDHRLQSDFAKYAARDFANALGDLLPAKLIPVIVRLSGIDPHRKVHSLTRAERLSLGKLLKHLELTVRDFRPITEAVVTAGGVEVRELNPRTMEAKAVRGLFFAGEVIDLDAYTGGFNLQIAFSTADAAARAIAAQVEEERIQNGGQTESHD